MYLMLTKEEIEGIIKNNIEKSFSIKVSDVDVYFDQDNDMAIMANVYVKNSKEV